MNDAEHAEELHLLLYTLTKGSYEYRSWDSLRRAIELLEREARTDAGIHDWERDPW